MLLNHLSVVLIRVTRINGWNCLPLSFQRRCPFLPKIFFKYHSVPGVGTKQCIAYIPYEREKSDAKIKYDIEIHFGSDISWEATIDLLACSEHHEGHERIDCVTDTTKTLAFLELLLADPNEILPRNYSNDAAPSEPNATAIAQTHVKTVSTPLDLGEDFPIVLGNACRQGLSSFLGLRRGASI
jgi:hypothetical protein